MADPSKADAGADLDLTFDAAFKSAIQDFRAKLKNEDLYRQILQTTSVDQVYDLTDKLQQEQSCTGRLRHLSKIEPFLEGLRGYATVIEVFVQAKPDVLAFIWGPVKLLLQWASALKQSMDAIVDTTANIGALLPEFRKVAQLFGHNGLIKEILVLFFKDMLEYYAIALEFFTSSGLRLCFEALWPKQRKKIEIVVSHIQRHTVLLRNEVRLEHIQAEYNFRRDALARFEQNELSLMRQEFQGIRTSIAPRTYQEQIQHLDDETCPEAGKWLLKNSNFCSWIGNSDTSPSVLWLQGIPGSGKTYLARLAVCETQKKGYSLFAFLTYACSKTTALSILHSLIFQLAANDADLQTIVCHSSGEKFRSSVEEATSVFRALLYGSKQVYITIDGLDEVEPVARCRILKILLQMASEIGTLGLLVSCRPEADLTDLLKDNSATIRVNDLNFGGIEAYITQRKLVLYNEREFIPEAQNEMDALLAPLATKSEGMFLYAKIVLDSIRFLEFEEMKKDLRVLPESLNEAYERILEKINQLQPPAAREKARTIIGWIGVSPMPLTIYELEQALVVHAQNINDMGNVRSKLTLVRLCGPIVEIVDDYVQFVHFTVQEYFLSLLIDNAIDPQKSKLSLTTSCVKYFCQPHHDSDTDLDTRSGLVLNGAFRLHDFAASNWLKLTRQVISNSASGVLPSELLELLKLLLNKRRNYEHVKVEEQNNTGLWKPLEKANPSLYALLCTSDTFQDMRSRYSFTARDNEDWINLDPLTISHIARDVHKQLENLLSTKESSEETIQQTLKRHYGARPFKCTYVDCPFQRHGFESKGLRNAHNKHHSKPWHCDFKGCEFEKGGFLSRRMRDDHLKQFHIQKQSLTHDITKKADTVVLQQFGYELVKADDVVGIKALAASGVLTESVCLGGLLECATQHASSEMIRALLAVASEVGADGKSTRPKTSYKDLLLGAVASNNLSTFQLLLKLRPEDLGKSARLGEWELRMGCMDIWYQLNDEMLDMVFTLFEQDTLKTKSGYMTCPRMISSFDQDEQILLRFWGQIPKSVWTTTPWKHAIRNVAGMRNCSIELVKYLLGQGVPIDARHGESSPTAVHEAIRQNTRKSAELARFLLLNGADPEATMLSRHVEKKIKDEEGAKVISKWLGISWDELVEQTKEKRQKLAGTKIENEVGGS